MFLSAFGIEQAGNGGQGRLQPFEGADVAFAGGGCLDAQDRGRVGVAQFLEVPQRQDLAVDRVQAIGAASSTLLINSTR